MNQSSLPKPLLAAGFMLASACHAQVGLRQIQSGDLPITLLYPTTAQTQPWIRGEFNLQVALNAKPQPSPQGKRFLIVLSHGTAGSSEPDHDLASTLVRAGFIVAEPQHRGDNWQDFSKAGPESWKTRPDDIRETIDAVAQDKTLGPLLRTDHVGVHGMSAGGVSALALAGGQWRILDLIRHCATHPDEDKGFCMNGLAGRPVKQWLRGVQFSINNSTPEKFLPDDIKALHGGLAASDPRPDPRVAAISLLVPLSAIFTPESLSRISIPVGVTLGESDEVLNPSFHGQHLLRHCRTSELLTSNPKAGHFDWLSPWPALIAQKVAATQVRGGNPNPLVTQEQKQLAFDRIASFFTKSLKSTSQ